MKTNLVQLKKSNPCHLIHLTEHLPIRPGKTKNNKDGKKKKNRLSQCKAYQLATCLIFA